MRLSTENTKELGITAYGVEYVRNVGYKTLFAVSFGHLTWVLEFGPGDSYDGQG